MNINIGLGGAGSASAGRRGATCTSDLRHVVDDDGVVVKECPSDQGCADGQCVPACDAAARSKGSVGCEFWALTPRSMDSGAGGNAQDGPCHAVFVANAWERPAKLSVSRAGQPLDLAAFARIPRGAGAELQWDSLPETGLPQNEVAVLFLSNRRSSPLSCPIAPAVADNTAIWGAERGEAFYVASDTPISAYDILPYGGPKSSRTSATLLLPVSTWGTNYTVLTPKAFGPEEEIPFVAARGRLWAAVVAREDQTTVKVAPKDDLPGGATLAPAPVGQVTEYTLDAGEAIQWIDVVGGLPTLDPSGTVLESDKPIGLWTGNTWLTVSSATSPMNESQDSAHQQVPSIRALGSEYVGGGIVTRNREGRPESVPYRLMGVVDGTTLEWDPRPESAPVQINRGEIVDLESVDAFSVRSQDVEHPFVFTQFMPGPQVNEGDCPGTSDCAHGDVEWVSLVSAEQFLKRYVFFIDPSYSTTSLVVVRRNTGTGFHDVELECLGTVSGWRPVGGEGTFEVAHLDLMRAGMPVRSCSRARHVAMSQGPFGIVVWGTDAGTSYGYPAGGNFGAINSVVVPTVVR
jgi:hypothetical protein